MANEKVIERLRESKRQAGVATYSDGRQAGREWAEASAEAAELERLAAIGAEQWALMVGGAGFDSSSAYGPSEQFVFLIKPDVDGERDEARIFWDFVGVSTWRSMDHEQEFVRGFAEAAKQVWDDVKDRL